MRKFMFVLSLLLLTGCTAPASQPVGEIPEPPAPAASPPRSAVEELHLGEIRIEEVPQDVVWVLPSAPRITARVVHTRSVRWLVHAGGGMDPFSPLLATLLPVESAPGEWTLQWSDPPRERVRLSLCAEVSPDYPDEPGLVRDGDRRFAVIASHTVQVLAPGTSLYIQQERALELARRVQPDAAWQARFVEAYELPGKSGVKRPTWVVEAVFTYGNRLVVYLDALTGEQLGVMQAEPPHFPDAPRPIDRDRAIQAALTSVDPAHVEVGEAVFRKGYMVLQQEYHVWVVTLLTRGERRPAGRVIVHAYTGQVLEPPSGQ